MSVLKATGEQRYATWQAFMPRYRMSAFILSGSASTSYRLPDIPDSAGGGAGASSDGGDARSGIRALRVGRTRSNSHTAGQSSRLKDGGATVPRHRRLSVQRREQRGQSSRAHCRTAPTSEHVSDTRAERPMR